MFEDFFMSLTWSDGALYLLYVLIIWIGWVFVHDISQKSHAIQRNYPVIGHFRYMFENMG